MSDSLQSRLELLESEPFPASVCHGCRWLKLVRGKNSAFLLCGNELLPKYPPQPVRQCSQRSAVDLP
jgi:hypothetical protein